MIKANIVLLLAFVIGNQSMKAQNFQWAKSMGGINFDEGHAVATDALGNVYTTGRFYGTADFDPGDGSFYLTSAGSANIFISKLDASGNFVWAKSMEGLESDFGFSIATDAFGNVYTTGFFSDTVDFDPGIGTHFLFASGTAGDQDIFISKLDASGNFIWAKSMGGAGWNQGRSIAVDATGNVYTTGHFKETVDFDPNAGTYNLTSEGEFDIFISKLDAYGNFNWAQRIGGVNNDYGISIALDATGNLVTTGSFRNTVDFDPSTSTFNLTSAGEDDIFISKYDAQGNFLWAKSIGGNSAEGGHSIMVDGSNNVFITGYYSETCDFDPSSGIYNLSAAGGQDIFISKLDALGNFAWAQSMGGNAIEGGYSISIDSDGGTYATGFFAGTVDFDPGVEVYNLTSEGSYDIFIVKLDETGNFVWANKIGGNSADEGRSIACNASGDLYITGYFSGNVDFDFSENAYNLTSEGIYDIFITKLNIAQVGISDLEGEDYIQAFPNPTNDIVYFSEPCDVQLFNVAGQLISDTNQAHSINLSSHASGIYFMHIKNNNTKIISRKRIIKT